MERFGVSNFAKICKKSEETQDIFVIQGNPKHGCVTRRIPLSILHNRAAGTAAR
jgi:hypothetical protein